METSTVAPTLWMRVRFCLAVVGILVGVSVFVVFGVHYHNWNVAGWGLISGCAAAATLYIHIGSARRLFEKDRNRLRLWMLSGCFVQLAGVCGFAVYLTLGVVQNQGLQIYDDGYYLALVWCFMTWKWGFALFYYSRSYKRLLDKYSLQSS